MKNIVCMRKVQRSGLHPNTVEDWMTRLVQSASMECFTALPRGGAMDRMTWLLRSCTIDSDTTLTRSRTVDGETALLRSTYVDTETALPRSTIVDAVVAFRWGSQWLLPRSASRVWIEAIPRSRNLLILLRLAPECIWSFQVLSLHFCH
jgi:hypothetical protein